MLITFLFMDLKTLCYSHYIQQANSIIPSPAVYLFLLDLPMFQFYLKHGGKDRRVKRGLCLESESLSLLAKYVAQ